MKTYKIRKIYEFLNPQPRFRAQVRVFKYLNRGLLVAIIQGPFLLKPSIMVLTLNWGFTLIEGLKPQSRLLLK
jgi:hypothetical protein